ncbi:monocarboxylate transporter 5-like [Strongylocentrotus purpuratus]|uniref:Uncharacterized protein n=1 Tax=Strongylocentrotus purpuratus TaxID=7668 RepID=A0A7M7GA52_STRPU|nr:monocarboxylate transporter 5-like [Strongylocentrotus purpuratus]|eukprot:XP_001200312.2 PREDICTED: monocarboxylate transporter 5-like [Strongylocentrotus purpuratus]
MANCEGFRNRAALKLVLALFLQTCYVLGTVKSIGVYLPELKVGLGLTSTDIGLDLGLFSAFAFGSGPIVAFLYQRLHGGYRRLLVMTGAFLAPGGLILGYLVTNNAQLASCLIASGLGYNILSISVVITLSNESGDAFIIFYGIGKSGYAFGMTFVPLLADYLMDIYDWRGSLLIIGGIMTHLIPLMMIVDINTARHCIQDAPGSSNSGAENPDESPDATDEESSARLVERASIRQQDEVTINGFCDQRPPGYGDNSTGKDNGHMDEVYEETTNDEIGLTKIPSVSSWHLDMRMNCSELCGCAIRILQNSVYNRDRWLVLLMFASLVYAMGSGSWYAFLIPRAVGRGIETRRALFLAYSSAAAAFITRCFGGLLVYKKIFSAQRLFSFLTLLNVASLLVDIFVPNVAVMIVTSFISSLSISFRNTLALVICKERALHAEFPLILASVDIVSGLGVLFGEWLSGFVADVYGSFNASFMFIAAVDGLVFCLMVPPMIAGNIPARS